MSFYLPNVMNCTRKKGMKSRLDSMLMGFSLELFEKLRITEKLITDINCKNLNNKAFGRDKRQYFLSNRTIINNFW